MSIDLDPSLYAYESPPNVCIPVYGAGQTPDTIFLSFNEIKKGDNWVAADGEPPNGLWEIPPNAPCNFSATIGGYLVTYSTAAGASGVLIQTPNATLAFVGTSGVAGTTNFPSIFTSPVGKAFYDGWCSVSSVVSSNQNNIQDLWESLGEIRQPETFDNLRSQDNLTSSHTFSRRYDATNIHITVDDS